VLFAYLKVPLVGIALFALPIAIMYVLFSDRGDAATAAPAQNQEVPA